MSLLQLKGTTNNISFRDFAIAANFGYLDHLSSTMTLAAQFGYYDNYDNLQDYTSCSDKVDVAPDDERIFSD